MPIMSVRKQQCMQPSRDGTSTHESCFSRGCRWGVTEEVKRQVRSCSPQFKNVVTGFLSSRCRKHGTQS